MNSEEEQKLVTNICDLPNKLLLRIFAFVYFRAVENDVSDVSQAVAVPGRPQQLAKLARTCKKFRAMTHSPLFSRICTITEHSIPHTDFKPFVEHWKQRSEHILELDACIETHFHDPQRSIKLSQALVPVINAAHQLRVLRLGGILDIASIFCSLAPYLHQFNELHTIYLAGGRDSFQLKSTLQPLAYLPNLNTLQIDFCNDTESTFPEGLEAFQHLTTLNHLALTWPLRSALPPQGQLPAEMSNLTALTTLKIRRVPLQNPNPQWLEHLTNLQHLMWDPYLAVEVASTVPNGLSKLVNLKTLWLEVRIPYAIPTTLTNLETLLLNGRLDQFSQVENQWDWLYSMTRLRCVRIQAGNLKTLPEPLLKLPLTSLSLNCNNLTSDLPSGEWVRQLKRLHLGGNKITNFPKTLREATHLKWVHLANQRDGAVGASVNLPQRMRLTGPDVSALLAMPDLTTVVMNLSQPVIDFPGQTKDFDYLQRVLRNRKSKGVKLTGDELQYPLPPLDMFNSGRLAVDLSQPGEGVTEGIGKIVLLASGASQSKEDAMVDLC